MLGGPPGNVGAMARTGRRSPKRWPSASPHGIGSLLWSSWGGRRSGGATCASSELSTSGRTRRLAPPSQVNRLDPVRLRLCETVWRSIAPLCFQCGSWRPRIPRTRAASSSAVLSSALVRGGPSARRAPPRASAGRLRTAGSSPQANQTDVRSRPTTCPTCAATSSARRASFKANSWLSSTR